MKYRIILTIEPKDVEICFLIGHPSPPFVYFRSFQKTYRLHWDSNSDRRKEGEHDDLLTKTTAKNV